MKFRILLFLTSLFFSFPVLSSHIAGGECFLKWIGRGNRYTLGLLLYYDDVHAQGDLKDRGIKLSVFEKGTDIFVEEIALPLQSYENFFDKTNPTCGDAEPIRILEYSDVIIFDPEVYYHPQGYYVTYERCCRNEGINNIETPEEIGMTFYLEFPPVVKNEETFRNSSPVFKPIESRYLCKGQFHQINFSAVDFNKDSLVYSLATPLKGFSTPDNSQNAPVHNPGPYPEVDWVSGFSRENMIPGNPGLSINRFTGEITVKPNLEGLFVMSVMVEEYRNKVKIGMVRREFQFTVRDCKSEDIKCRVTNSSATGKNIVLFENPADLSLGDSIFVYSDTEIMPFAKSGKNDITIAEDKISDADSSSHQYKVFVKYKDQQETLLCDNLESLNLKFLSQGGINKLVWNRYNDKNISNYQIIGGNDKYTLNLLAEVSSETFDFNLGLLSSFYKYYRIQVKKQECGSAYNAIRSNLVTNLLVGISDKLEESTIKVYPNPSSGEFTITDITNNSTVTVYNSLGNIVLQANPLQKNIDLKLGEIGIFIVEVKDIQKVYRKYLIIH